MRNLHILLLSVLLIFGVGFFASVALVNAFSETFPLAETAGISRMAELDEGDQLTGSFTISNIPVWKNGLGQSVTYSYSVTLYDPHGQIVLKYDDRNQASFDHTAFYTGVYKFQFYVGMSQWYHPEGLGNAQASLNYNIIKPTSNDKTTTTPIEISPPIIAGIVTTVIILMGCGVYFFARSRRKVQIA